MSISVLIVDDSALIRSLLTEIISAQADMHVVGAAADAYAARELVKQYNPDVITLDIEMPKVDGLTFLDKLMKAKPTPVVMISTLTDQGADATIRALQLGAVDFVPKPKLGVAQGIKDYEKIITNKIRLASQAQVRAIGKQRSALPEKSLPIMGTEKIIAIGASTGGTEAIRVVLEQLPSNSPAVVVTQHMPPGFTSSFANRLNSICKIQVKEAVHDERILPGHAYIAPGAKHLLVRKFGADYRIVIDDSERVSGHKPSVDVMFRSLADCAGKNVVAAILTGMGRDGADGLLALKDSGAYTLAQDEASCVVYGMPKEAMKNGAALEQVPLDEITNALLSHLTQNTAGSRL